MSASLDLDHNVTHRTIDEHAELRSRARRSCLDLLQARDAVTGGGNQIYFGPEREAARIEARGEEIGRLSQESVAALPSRPAGFEGGEHKVWVVGEPVSEVLKATHSGCFGSITDEKPLFDSRTLQNRRQLYIRRALPSEYLLRWAVLADVFLLPTIYKGTTFLPGLQEPSIVVAQPFVPQDDDDPPSLSEIFSFMQRYEFTQVDPGVLANPEVKDATWYRQRDGILITDALPRNFRKHNVARKVVPIDLVLTLVPTAGFHLLPQPLKPWQPPNPLE